MTIDAWLEQSCADAERRGLPELQPLLKTLAQATRALRASDWNDDATGGAAPDGEPGAGTRQGDRANR